MQSLKAVGLRWVRGRSDIRTQGVRTKLENKKESHV